MGKGGEKKGIGKWVGERDNECRGGVTLFKKEGGKLPVV